MGDDSQRELRQISAESTLILAELRRVLAEISRTARGTLIVAEVARSARGRTPKSALQPTRKDMDERLRAIDHYVSARRLAELLDWSVETVYRQVKTGLPADRNVDGEGKGRSLKFYPPAVAAWIADCREDQKRLVESRQASRALSTDNKNKEVKE